MIEITIAEIVLVVLMVLIVIVSGILAFLIIDMFRVQLYQTFVRPLWRTDFKITYVKSLSYDDKHTTPIKFLEQHLSYRDFSFSSFPHVKMKKLNNPFYENYTESLDNIKNIIGDNFNERT